MFKKLAIVAVVLTAGAVVLWKVKPELFQKERTLEEQIAEQEQLLRTCDEEIKKNIRQVALREVEAKDLEKEIQEIKARQAENEKVILAVRQELRSDTTLVRAGKAREKEKELGRILDAYKGCAKALKAKEEKLSLLREAIQAARAELVAYQDERSKLEIELEELKTLLAQTRVEEIKSRVSFDKSKLAKIQKNTAELRRKIEVRQKEIELQGQYLGKHVRPQTETRERNVLKEVDELFGKGR